MLHKCKLWGYHYITRVCEMTEKHGTNGVKEVTT